MQTINVLIIASSDMDGTGDSHNFPSDILNITFPCNKYNGKLLNVNEIKHTQIHTRKSPRCSKCHYTELEHKYGYPLYPLHPIKTQIGVYAKTMGELAGKPVYSLSEFSDFWKNKTTIFERIKFIYGNDININYHTITPEYKNDLTYLPIINKINTIVEKNLKLKGKITYQEPYHFSCMLNEIYKQNTYKNTLYDCIFVVSGGLGSLYKPDNFRIMTKLLQKDINKQAIIGNVFYTPKLSLSEYGGEMKFINPINSLLQDNSITIYEKKDVNECIRNYTKILLGNTFLEAYDMLYRQSKPNKSKKNIKHKTHKTNKKTKSKKTK